MRPNRSFAALFVAQAVVGTALWVWYDQSAAFRRWVGLVPSHHAVTSSFLLPDFVVIVLGSLLAAWGLDHDRPWATAAAAFTTGGVLYPTIYLVAFVLAAHRGGAVLAIMVSPSVICTWMSLHLLRTDPAAPTRSAPT